MDPDPRKEIEVDPDPDPDLDPERGLKWIRIRPNAVDPGGSGSETLVRSVIDNFPMIPYVRLLVGLLVWFHFRALV